MANTTLSAAKNAKNDEYYTRYEDIQEDSTRERDKE